MARSIYAKVGLAVLVIAVAALPAQASFVQTFGGGFGQNTLQITLENLGGPPGDTGLAVTIAPLDMMTPISNANVNTINNGSINPVLRAHIGDLTNVLHPNTFVVNYNMSGSMINFDPPQTGNFFDVFYGAAGDAHFTFDLVSGGVATVLGEQFLNISGDLFLLSQVLTGDDYSLFFNGSGMIAYTLDAPASATSTIGHLSLLNFLTSGATGDTFVLTAAYTASDNVTPEPMSLTLLGIGSIVSVGFFRRRTKVS